MPDDETERLRRENADLRSEREVLVSMVRRAAREIMTPLKKDILADLEGFLSESRKHQRS